MRVLPSPFKRIERLRFSSDGAYLIGSGIGITRSSPGRITRGIVFWPLEESEEIQIRMPEVGIAEFEPIPGGNQILVECRYRALVRTGPESSNHETRWYGRSASIIGLSASRMEQVEVLYEHRPEIDSLQSMVCDSLTEIPSLVELWRRPVANRGRIVTLSFAPDGESFWASEQVTIPTPTRRVRFLARLVQRHSADGSTIRSFSTPAVEVRQIVLSPDHERIALLTGPTVWVSSTERFDTDLKVLVNDTPSFFTDLCFDPTSQLLAVASNDSTIKLFETTSWSQISSFSWHSSRMRSVCFSPDGFLAAAGTSAGQVVIWDVDR